MVAPRKLIALSAGIAIGAAAVTLHARAQQAQPPQAVILKGRAPVSTEILKVKLPRPAEVDLPNGLHLMVLEDRRTPQVSFQLLIPGAGGYFDPSGNVGLAQVTAIMMREGTSSRTTVQIAELLETKAAAVGVGASLAGVSATVSGSSLTENFAETFALAADILLNPTFPQDELDRVRVWCRSGPVPAFWPGR
jgi:zinc protease